MTTRQFLVLVTPVADEAARINAGTTGTPSAGLAWLKHQRRAGVIIADAAWADDDGTPRTGGFMLVEIEDRDALFAWLADYPLLPSIDLDVRALCTLDEGFAVLRDDVDRIAGEVSA